MQLVDLSHPITAGMPVYPGDPEVAVEPALSLAEDGAQVSKVTLGTHTGTHLDAPAHVVADGRTVDQLALDLLHGPAYVVQIRTTDLQALRGRPLGLEDLAALPERLPAIVCVATGWDQYFHDPAREDHPYLSIEVVHTLWQKGARVLGVDTLSPDATAQDTTDNPVHEFWLGHDGIIVENLTGLTKLPAHVQMSILPLSLAGLDGSPVRAVAQYP